MERTRRNLPVDGLNPSEAYCEGKRRFASPALAYRVAKRRGIKSQEPYRCPKCGGWHIGTKRHGQKLTRMVQLHPARIPDRDD